MSLIPYNQFNQHAQLKQYVQLQHPHPQHQPYQQVNAQQLQRLQQLRELRLQHEEVQRQHQQQLQQLNRNQISLLIQQQEATAVAPGTTMRRYNRQAQAQQPVFVSFVQHQAAVPMYDYNPYGFQTKQVDAINEVTATATTTREVIDVVSSCEEGGEEEEEEEYEQITPVEEEKEKEQEKEEKEEDEKEEEEEKEEKKQPTTPTTDEQQNFLSTTSSAAGGSSSSGSLEDKDEKSDEDEDFIHQHHPPSPLCSSEIETQPPSFLSMVLKNKPEQQPIEAIVIVIEPTKGQKRTRKNEDNEYEDIKERPTKTQKTAESSLARMSLPKKRSYPCAYCDRIVPIIRETPDAKLGGHTQSMYEKCDKGYRDPKTQLLLDGHPCELKLVDGCNGGVGGKYFICSWCLPMNKHCALCSFVLNENSGNTKKNIHLRRA